MKFSGCAPAIDGYGPECNRMGEAHTCGLVESPEEGWLVWQVGTKLLEIDMTMLNHFAHARRLIWMVREHDEENGDGR